MQLADQVAHPPGVQAGTARGRPCAGPGGHARRSARRRRGRARQRRQQLGHRDARLVRVGHLAQRHVLGELAGRGTSVMSGRRRSAHPRRHARPTAPRGRRRPAPRGCRASGRAPTAIARSISATGLVDPLTEISSGGTSARSAISSSAAPKTSQPAPSWFRIRRSAMLGFAFSDDQHARRPVRPGAGQGRQIHARDVRAELRLGDHVQRACRTARRGRPPACLRPQPPADAANGRLGGGLHGSA